jgi:hypothetical protein
MGTKIFDLYGKLSLDLGNFKSGLVQAGTVTSGFMRTTSYQMSDLSKKMGGLGREFMFLGGAAGAGIYMAFKNLAHSQTEIMHMSDQLAVGTTELKRMKFAADMVDLSLEDLGKNIVKQQKFMAGASNKSLAAMGLDPKAIKEAGADKAMGSLLDMLSKVTDANKRAALAMAIWGKSGANMLRFLHNGKNELKEFIVTAEELGIKLDDETGEGFRKLEENLKRNDVLTKMLGNSILTTLMPTINQWTTTYEKNIKAGIQLVNQNKETVGSVGKWSMNIVGGITAIGTASFALSKVLKLVGVGLNSWTIAAVPAILGVIAIIESLNNKLDHTNAISRYVKESGSLSGKGADTISKGVMYMEFDHAENLNVKRDYLQGLGPRSLQAVHEGAISNAGLYDNGGPTRRMQQNADGSNAGAGMEKLHALMEQQNAILKRMLERQFGVGRMEVDRGNIFG